MTAITAKCTNRQETQLMVPDSATPPNYTPQTVHILTFTQILGGNMTPPLGTVMTLILSDPADWPNYSVGTIYTVSFAGATQATV